MEIRNKAKDLNANPKVTIQSMCMHTYFCGHGYDCYSHDQKQAAAP